MARMGPASGGHRNSASEGRGSSGSRRKEAFTGPQPLCSHTTGHSSRAQNAFCGLSANGPGRAVGVGAREPQHQPSAPPVPARQGARGPTRSIHAGLHCPEGRGQGYAGGSEQHTPPTPACCPHNPRAYHWYWGWATEMWPGLEGHEVSCGSPTFRPTRSGSPPQAALRGTVILETGAPAPRCHCPHLSTWNPGHPPCLPQDSYRGARVIKPGPRQSPAPRPCQRTPHLSTHPLIPHST